MKANHDFCLKCGKVLGLFESDVCDECRKKAELTTTESTAQISYTSQYIPKSVIEDIRSEIAEYRDNFVLAGRGNIASAVDNCNRIIDKHIKAVEE